MANSTDRSTSDAPTWSFSLAGPSAHGPTDLTTTSSPTTAPNTRLKHTSDSEFDDESSDNESSGSSQENSGGIAQVQYQPINSSSSDLVDMMTDTSASHISTYKTDQKSGNEEESESDSQNSADPELEVIDMDSDDSPSTSGSDQPLSRPAQNRRTAAPLQSRRPESGLQPTSTQKVAVASASSSGGSNQATINKSRTFDFERQGLPYEMRYKILALHLTSMNRFGRKYLDDAGMIVLYLDNQPHWGQNLRSVAFIRTSKITSAVSLDVLYGNNHFALFGRQEGARRLPRYVGYQNLHTDFLKIIRPHNVQRLRKLTLSANTRLGCDLAPPAEMTFRQLTRRNPGLCNLTMLVLEVELLDYVLRSPDELANLMSSKHDTHLQHLGQSANWRLALQFKIDTLIRRVCGMVNISIWKTMVFQHARIIENFFPKLQYVYEAGEAEVRCLILSAKPLDIEHPLPDAPIQDLDIEDFPFGAPIQDWEGLSDNASVCLYHTARLIGGIANIPTENRANPSSHTT
jgi:hypothetical protein